MSTSAKAWRAQLAAQARHRCGYCLTQEVVSGVHLTLEHVIPRSQGGPTDETNLWLSCRLCNESKGVLTSFADWQSGERVPLFNPCMQNWSEHFAWDESGTRIRGHTAAGRATVAALDLNNEFWVRARTLWVEAGWHPPAD